MKEKYSTLSLRIKDIKKNHIGEKEYQYSRNNYAGNPLIWAETTSPSTIAESRSSNDEIHTLLYVYQGDGAEYSLSPKGERLIFRKHPRKGALHTHEFVELMYVISGSFSQYISGELYTFKANTFVITDQNCKHADYISEKNADVIFIQMNADFINMVLNYYNQPDSLQEFLFHTLSKQNKEESILELHPNKSLSPSQFKELKKEVDVLLEQLLQEDLARKEFHLAMKYGLISRLLHMLCYNYTPIKHSTSPEEKEKFILYEVERYIRTHFQTVTVADLENEFHYSRNYYAKLLKKYRDTSFRDYVQSVRLKEAVRLLTGSTLSVKQIALQCGYENTSFFYHLFEKTYGISPTEYRAKYH